MQLQDQFIWVWKVLDNTLQQLLYIQQEDINYINTISPGVIKVFHYSVYVNLLQQEGSVL